MPISCLVATVPAMGLTAVHHARLALGKRDSLRWQLGVVVQVCVDGVCRVHERHRRHKVRTLILCADRAALVLGGLHRQWLWNAVWSFGWGREDHLLAAGLGCSWTLRCHRSVVVRDLGVPWEAAATPLCVWRYAQEDGSTDDEEEELSGVAPHPGMCAPQHQRAVTGGVPAGMRFFVTVDACGDPGCAVEPFASVAAVVLR